MLTIPRPVRILATSIAALISANSLQAQIWDGGGGDNNLSTGLNWDTNVAPLTNGTADLTFAGIIRLTPNVSVPLSVDSITFNNTAGAFTIGGSALSLGVNGITNNDADLQSFTANVTIATPTSSINATSGALSFGNGITVSGTNAVTLTGGSAIGVTSFVGTGTVNKSNAGTLNLSQFLSLDADLNLSAGATNLVATGVTAIATSNSTIALTGTASFAMNENLTLSGAQFTRATGTGLTFGAGKTLTVQNGGDLISVSALLLSGSNGAVSVTGIGSSIQTTAAAVTISNGTLATVSSGAALSSSTYLDIGTSGISGLTVEGTGSSVTSAGGVASYWGTTGGTANVIFRDAATATINSLSIAQGTASNTTGNVTVESGATVNGSNLTIANGGAGTGVSGTLTVTGAGSAWTQSGSSALTVGAVASTVGILNVNSAGTFTSGTGIISIGATGSVSINDGSFNANGNIVQTGQFTRSESGVFNLAAGRSWTIQGGGDATITGFQTFAANNAITVTGAGSSMVSDAGFISGSLDLTGGSSISVNSGGSFTTDYHFIGSANSGGALTVDGSGSTWNSDYTIIGGDYEAMAGGTGNVTLSNNAQANVNAIFMGMSTGATGTLLIESGADLTTDYLGTGEDNALYYTGAASTSNVTVTGAGSSFTTTGETTIGSNYGGAGTFTLASSATTTIANTGSFLVVPNGIFNQTGGTLNVNGALFVRQGGQYSKSGGSLAFGANSSLTVSSAGDFNLDDAGPINTGTSQSISVDGVGSSITGTGSSALSIRNGASLSVTNGGSVDLESYLDVGSGSNLVVDGVGSSLTAADRSDIGTNGVGTATFRNGGAGSYDQLYIGAFGGNTGTVNIQSGASLMVNTISLGSTNVLGSGNLNVDAQSTVTITDLMIASSGTLTLNGGIVNINGPITYNGGALVFNSGKLNVSGDLSVGDASLLSGNFELESSKQFAVGGQLTIDPFQSVVLNGGQLSAGSIINNGQLLFESGTLAITGAGGATVGSGQPLGAAFNLEAGSNFVVNNQLATAADGVLTMNGGSVTAGSFSNSGQIRINEGITNITGAATNNNGGQMFVSDSFSTGGTLTNASGGRITLRDGTGQLAGAGALSNTGLITGDGRITKALTNNAGGEVRAESGKTIAFTGANAANAGKFNLLGGMLEFAQAQTNGATGQINGHGTLNFTNGLSNAGQMNFSGGNSDVFGVVNSVAGSRVITSGGSTATFYDAFTNNATEVRTSANSATVFFGLVNGAGPFTGTGEVYYEGGYSPGNSPALVTTESSIFFGNNNTLTMEIGGITAGSEYDKLVFNGEQLQFGGELVIALLQNFSLTAGMEFDLFDFDPNNAQGSFSNIRTAEPLANGLTIDTSKIASNGTFTVVPEPSSAALVMITSAMLGLRRRRNSRNQA